MDNWLVSEWCNILRKYINGEIPKTDKTISIEEAKERLEIFEMPYQHSGEFDEVYKILFCAMHGGDTSNNLKKKDPPV